MPIHKTAHSRANSSNAVFVTYASNSGQRPTYSVSDISLDFCYVLSWENPVIVAVQYLFQPGSRALRLIFHSSQQNPEDRPDPSVKYRYRLRYQILNDCGGLFQEPAVSDIPGEEGMTCYTRIPDKRGSIHTPFYPEYYSHNLDCVYEFIRQVLKQLLSQTPKNISNYFQITLTTVHKDLQSI